MEQLYYIYKITNILSGKIYVGQSKDPARRWSDHKSLSKLNPKQYIHRAMAKYGIENFTFEIIAEYTTQQEVDLAENDFINKFDSRNKEYGYNLKPGGKVRGIWNHSEETRKKLKENWHKIHSPESVAKTAAANRGQKRGTPSEECRRKIGEANKIALKGKKQPQEVIDKRVAAINEKYGGKKCNAPGCERVDGYKHNGVRYCELHIQRLLKYGNVDLSERTPHNKGKPMSEEAKQRLSESLKGQKAWNKGISHSEETKQKLSELLKGKEPPNKIKFSDEDIDKIVNDPRGYRKLAKEFGVSQTVIARIRREYGK